MKKEILQKLEVIAERVFQRALEYADRHADQAYDVSTCEVIDYDDEIRFDFFFTDAFGWQWNPTVYVATQDVMVGNTINEKGLEKYLYECLIQENS